MSGSLSATAMEYRASKLKTAIMLLHASGTKLGLNSLAFKATELANCSKPKIRLKATTSQTDANGTLFLVSLPKRPRSGKPPSREKAKKIKINILFPFLQLHWKHTKECPGVGL